MAFAWLALALLYLATLFWVARWAESGSHLAKKLSNHPLVYSLALTIYCTAWTYFGSVGEAVRTNWDYLPVLLGPVLLYLFGYRFLLKLVLVSKKQHINTIADFIASRYGKRQAVAVLVTCIALLATIPYIALQLKALGSAFSMVTGQAHSELIVFVATAFIAIFAIYFGTKQTDITEHRHGLILAIAFESIIKLLALLAVAIVGYIYWQKSATAEVPAIFIQQASFEGLFTFSFWAQTLMAAAAVVCLPRQFHVAIIENTDPKHLKWARWVFPFYMLVLASIIPLIASAGYALFSQQAIEPDTYVLTLSMLSDSVLLQVLVFVGGLSAATAMIIVATLTLSTMVTNDVILPKLLESSKQEQAGNYTKIILLLRRIVIGLLLLLAYFYHQQMTNSKSLASIGLIAFSLVIQLLPAIVGGLYWKKGHANGVFAGLGCALVIWCVTALLPYYLDSDVLQSERVLWAAVGGLVGNIIAYIVFSLQATPRLIDRVQAQAFVEPKDEHNQLSNRTMSHATVGDLVTLLSMFLGESRCQSLLGQFSTNTQQSLEQNNLASPQFLQFSERALGGVLGASSARALIETAIRGKRLNFEEVVNFFDDTTQALKFNITALITSLESLEQGISVVDKNLNLVAWNKKYLDLFDYPSQLVAVGVPVEKLVRYNAERGECGLGDIDVLVNKRLEFMRQGSSHRFLRQRSDGRVIEMVGNPLPGGGFVTSFNDVTAHIEIQHALEEANIDLENRVQKRTDEVQAINAELRVEIARRTEVEKALEQARKVAEQANASKTRFLALASHDILQPLNASKLYLSALEESNLGKAEQDIVSKLNDSVSASETLIGVLLEIARIDQGDLKPILAACSLKATCQPLIDEFSMTAEQKGLQLRAMIADVWAQTDPTYLHRIVRNLLSNAIKYTNKGKVLLLVRKRAGQVLIQIYDTGVGIADHEQNKIFNDFYRIDDSKQRGLGLGLSVVARFSQQLGSQIQIDSAVGKGSRFQFLLPRCEAKIVAPSPTLAERIGFKGLRVLVVDDQQANLDAMQTLLRKWQCDVYLADDQSHARELARQHQPQLLLIDYQLSAQQNGLQLIVELRKLLGQTTHAVLITANQEDNLLAQCKQAKVNYFAKPVKPAKLRVLMQSLLGHQC